MDLLPSEPPGHAGRKLRNHLSEIERLRREGYTIRAIHQALKSAGIEVSWASVQREVARAKSATKKSGSAGEAQREARLPDASPSGRQGSMDLNQYFDQHNSNPLFNRRSS